MGQHFPCHTVTTCTLQVSGLFRHVQHAIHVAESSSGFYFLQHAYLFCADVVISTFKATLLRKTMYENATRQYYLAVKRLL